MPSVADRIKFRLYSDGHADCQSQISVSNSSEAIKAIGTSSGDICQEHNGLAQSAPYEWNPALSVIHLQQPALISAF
jgi:hypothetical protein